MTQSAVERVPVVASGRGLAHWGETDLRVVAAVCAGALGWDGAVLPAARVYGATVFPVVTWDDTVLDFRTRCGLGPVVERGRVHQMLSPWGPGDPGDAVRPQGFVAVGTPSASRAGLVALSIYAPVASVVPAPPGVAMWDALEASFYGVHVLEYGPDGTVEVTVRGCEGPNPSARAVPEQARLLREQMYDLAVRTGEVPVTDGRWR